MSPLRSLARPLLSAIFISSGINTLKDPSYAAHTAKESGLSEPELLAKAHGAINLVCGAGLATGTLPRLSALLLAGNLVPTSLMGHAFWSAPEDQKQMQQIHFLKNMSLLGGLLLAVADTGGRESVTHAAVRVAQRNAKKADKRASEAAKQAAKARAKAKRTAAKKLGKGSAKTAMKAGKPVAAAKAVGKAAKRAA